MPPWRHSGVRLEPTIGRGWFLLIFVVSALGANSQSRVFYNRVKGQLEESLRGLGYPRLTIVRPSLLLGPRAELRLGEEVAKRVTRWLGPLVPRAFKPVEARNVAIAIVRATRENGSGVRIIESGEIAVA